jgi:hypothetical protein
MALIFLKNKYFISTSEYHTCLLFEISFSTCGSEIILKKYNKGKFMDFSKKKDYLLMMQVEGPSYKLMLKKEKAHDMDINCVRWCPQVVYEI